MSAPGLGFVTHHEVEALASTTSGGAQQRRRLTKRGLFPKPPHWLTADRDKLAVFPEFALAALAIHRAPTPRQADVLKHAVAMTHKLYGTRSYRRLAVALRESLALTGSRDVTALAINVLQYDSDALSAWRDDVAEALSRLEREGLRLEALPARVADAQPGFYIVEIVDRGNEEQHELVAAPFNLLAGAWVTRDRLCVGSSMRDFLLPVPDLSQHRWMVEPTTAEPEVLSEEDEFVAQLLDGYEAPARAIPHLGPARMTADADPAPAEPQISVEVPMELMLDANTMTRVPRRA